ncbi:uncharacterized protein LOC122509801 [Leptopilina heterotoma]|uniref:uncharacterized protein LOC122509801 n=1 Tax=Leptopilina heterotoma TaxID=63436 RepID=UPI001CA97840|nr:uncharacterized protein LOC122509801 [Leptopilina heterotoma]
MANHIIAELDTEVLICARDILTIRPVPDDIFTQLKTRIIFTYSISVESRLRQFLKGDIPTDGKPSLILNRLRNLGDINCSDEVVRSVFLNQLPPSTRAILAASKVSTIQELADLADKVYETTYISPSCSVVDAVPISRPSSFSEPLSIIQNQISDLCARVDALSSKSFQSTGHRFRSESHGARNNNRSRLSSRNAGSNCWYHHKFGNKATKCKEPCSFSGKSSVGKSSEN